MKPGIKGDERTAKDRRGTVYISGIPYIMVGIGIMTGKKRAQCKVCTSPNLEFYEVTYYKARGMLSYPRMSEIASDKGEGISRKSFERHFKNHYSPDKVVQLLDRNLIESSVQKSSKDAIDILDEIKANLAGLKALLDGSKLKTKNLGDIVAVYREHRMTLQEIERLRTKLTATTSMSEAEVLKLMYWAASELCPDCRENFWVKLNEKLKDRGYGAGT